MANKNHTSNKREVGAMKHFHFLLLLLLPLLLPSITGGSENPAIAGEEVVLSKKHKRSGYQVALFAGGCFWCLEPTFEHLDGVIEAQVGYSGGKKETAKYYEVANGSTEHLETVRVVYDPKILPYTKLLDIYWRFIDPSDDGGQYDDRGKQYTTAIFYLNPDQKHEAEQSKKLLADSGKYSKVIVTRIIPASPFYLGEERHQNFYEKRFPTTKTIE